VIVAIRRETDLAVEEGHDVHKITFINKLKNDGWVIFENMLSDDFVQKMRRDVLKWVDICKQYQIEGKINSTGDGTAHHAVGGNDSIDEFLGLHLFHLYLAEFFEQRPYILHACNPVGGFPNNDTYLQKVHRDVATYIPGYNLRINMIVMLDDFTIENGATRILSGSHLCPEQPDEKGFDENCVPILGKAGSVVLFNSYTWHRGGQNRTPKNRVALTLSFGPAFIKPQMDYARLLGESYGSNLNELSRQVLGYNSRVPTNLGEWYRIRSERLYKDNQG
jgi:ectoine hydroxylase-related dioxygenase (phytanoyl-CoA dioxygenase family)